MILVRNIRLPLSAGEPQAFEKALHAARIPRGKVQHLGVAKLSVDARHGQPKLVYTVAVTLKEPAEEAAFAARCGDASLQKKVDLSVQNGTLPLAHRPVVCGLGPAGLFAALLLARQGYRPIVLERGPALDERVKAVEHFSATGELDVNANIQFGEGGAGTFSDGKLTTRIGDELCGFVTEVFLQHGAPEEIAWKQKPHVGTDLLRGVITSIRKEIEALGGEVHFNTALTGFEQKNGALTGIFTTSGTFACEALVFAVGHSARDTFGMLMDGGFVLECKPFSVGFRAEHLQSEIEKSLYHEAAGHPALPRGEYQLSQHVGGRCVYTFCMCPGGFGFNASSGECLCVFNGSWNHGTDEENANSGIVVNVTPEDFAADGFADYGVLAGVEFQKKYEHLAYEAGNGKIPVQLFADYKANRVSTEFGSVKPNIRGGYQFANLNKCLPAYINDAIIEGILDYDRKLKGFSSGDAVLSGIESRTSSPVRIVRDETYRSDYAGLFPCGEGAGYAGGITSAAVDGIKVAEAVAAYINNIV